MEPPGALLNPSSKNENNPLLKKFLIFSQKSFFLILELEMELSGYRIKKFLIFSQKKFFLYFGK